jgi:hypothetical protein
LIFIKKTETMNQYDQMKKMLTISRKGVVRQRLREDTGQYYNQNKESGRQLTPQEIEDEKAEFAGNVTKLSQFNDFKVGYDNVEWGGFFPQEKIEWVYSLEADEGVYISCELTQLTAGTLELIQRLYGYYTKWADKWQGEIGVKGNENTDQANAGGEQNPQGQPASGGQAPPPPMP